MGIFIHSIYFQGTKLRILYKTYYYIQVRRQMRSIRSQASQKSSQKAATDQASQNLMASRPISDYVQSAEMQSLQKKRTRNRASRVITEVGSDESITAQSKHQKKPQKLSSRDFYASMRSRDSLGKSTKSILASNEDNPLFQISLGNIHIQKRNLTGPGTQEHQYEANELNPIQNYIMNSRNQQRHPFSKSQINKQQIRTQEFNIQEGQDMDIIDDSIKDYNLIDQKKQNYILKQLNKRNTSRSQRKSAHTAMGFRRDDQNQALVQQIANKISRYKSPSMIQLNSKIHGQSKNPALYEDQSDLDQLLFHNSNEMRPKTRDSKGQSQNSAQKLSQLSQIYQSNQAMNNRKYFELINTTEAFKDNTEGRYLSTQPNEANQGAKHRRQLIMTAKSKKLQKQSLSKKKTKFRESIDNSHYNKFAHKFYQFINEEAKRQALSGEHDNEPQFIESIASIQQSENEIIKTDNSHNFQEQNIQESQRELLNFYPERLSYPAYQSHAQTEFQPNELHPQQNDVYYNCVQNIVYNNPLKNDPIPNRQHQNNNNPHFIDSSISHFEDNIHQESEYQFRHSSQLQYEEPYMDNSRNRDSLTKRANSEEVSNTQISQQLDQLFKLLKSKQEFSGSRYIDTQQKSPQIMAVTKKKAQELGHFGKRRQSTQPEVLTDNQSLPLNRTSEQENLEDFVYEMKERLRGIKNDQNNNQQRQKLEKCLNELDQDGPPEAFDPSSIEYLITEPHLPRNSRNQALNLPKSFEHQNQESSIHMAPMTQLKQHPVTSTQNSQAPGRNIFSKLQSPIHKLNEKGVTIYEQKPITQGKPSYTKQITMDQDQKIQVQSNLRKLSQFFQQTTNQQLLRIDEDLLNQQELIMHNGSYDTDSIQTSFQEGSETHQKSVSKKEDKIQPLKKYPRIPTIKQTSMEKFIDWIYTRKLQKLSFKENKNMLTFDQIEEFQNQSENEDTETFTDSREQMAEIGNSSTVQLSSDMLKLKKSVLFSQLNDAYVLRYRQKNITQEDNLNESIFNKDVQKVLISAIYHKLKTVTTNNTNQRLCQNYICQHRTAVQKIIDISDLEKTNFERVYSKKRQQKNERFMIEIEGCDHTKTVDQVLQNSINFQMLVNIKRNLDQEVDGTHFIHEHHQELLCKFKNKRKDLVGYRKQQSRKASILISIKNKVQYQEYAKHVDKQWNLKNNKPSFIYLDNPIILDKANSSLSIFDVKTKTSIFDVFQEFDWGMVQQNEQLLIQKQQIEQDKFSKIQQNRVNQIINNISQAILQRAERNSNILIQKIHEDCLKVLLMEFKTKTRSIDINYKFKTGLLHRQILKYIFETKILENQYEKNQKQMRFHKKYLKEQNKQQSYELACENQKFICSFKQSHCSQLVNKNDLNHIQKVLFSFDQTSIYNKLNRPEMDIYLHVMIKNICNQVKREELESNLRKNILKNQVNHLKINKKSYHVKPEYNTTDHIEIFAHLVQTSSKFSEVRESLQQSKVGGKKRLHRMNTVSKYPVQQVRQLERQNALDIYGNDYLEFLISQMLETNQIVVKDSMSTFYKNISSQIDQDDQDYNPLSKRHGYKSQFVRDPKNAKFIMEAFKPINLKQAKNKKKNINKWCGPKPGNGRDSHIDKFGNCIKYCDKFKSQKNQQQKKKTRRILKQVQTDDILTDDSMKGIDYRDIDMIETEQKSSNSDKSAPSSERSSQRRNSKRNSVIVSKMKLSNILINIQTPQEYYEDLRLKREETQHFNQEKSNSPPKMLDIGMDSIDSTQKLKKQINLFRNIPKVSHVKNQDQFRDQETHANIIKMIHRNKEIERAMQIAKQNVEDDNIDQILMKQANANMAKEILKKIENKMTSQSLFMQVGKANDFQDKDKDTQELNKRLIQGILDSYEEEETNLIKQLGINKLYSEEMADELVHSIQVGKHENKANELKKQLFRNQSTKIIKESSFNDSFKQILNSTTRSLSQQKIISSITQLQPVKRSQDILSNELVRKSQIMYKKFRIQNELKTKIMNLVINKDLQLKNHQAIDFEFMNEIKVMNKIRMQNKKSLQEKVSKQKRRDKILMQLQGGAKKQKVEVKVKTGKQKMYEMKIVKRIKQSLQQQRNSIQKGKEQSCDTDWNPWRQFQPLRMPQVEVDVIKKTIQQEGNRRTQQNHNAIASNLFAKKKMLEAIRKNDSMLMADLLRRFPLSGDIIDQEGNGLVANAVKYGDSEMVHLLVQEGFSINGSDKNGNTPLHYAISGKLKRIQQILLQQGADEHIVNNEGLTPWQLSSS